MFLKDVCFIFTAITVRNKHWRHESASDHRATNHIAYLKTLIVLNIQLNHEESCYFYILIWNKIIFITNYVYILVSIIKKNRYYLFILLYQLIRPLLGLDELNAIVLRLSTIYKKCFSLSSHPISILFGLFERARALRQRCCVGSTSHVGLQCGTVYWRWLYFHVVWCLMIAEQL